MTLYAPADWWPRAVQRPVPFWADGGQFTSRPLGWVMHVVVGNGSPYETFASSVAPDRKSAHLWIAKDGSSEQYVPFSRIAWHASAANESWYGAETEGFPTEPLTDAQITTLAEFHRWSATVDVASNAVGTPGICCHYVGGAAWGGHTCPDPSPGVGPRSHQRAAIIAAAQGDAPMTQAEMDALTNEIETRFQVHVGKVLENRDQALGDEIARTDAIAAKVDALTAAVAQMEAKLAAGAPVSIPPAFSDAIAAAVVKGLPTQTALTQADLRAAFAAVLGTVHP